MVATRNASWTSPALSVTSQFLMASVYQAESSVGSGPERRRRVAISWRSAAASFSAPSLLPTLTIKSWNASATGLALRCELMRFVERSFGRSERFVRLPGLLQEPDFRRGGPG